MRRQRLSPRQIKQQTRENLEFEEILGFFAQKAQTTLGKSHILAMKLMGRQAQAHHFELLERWCEWLAFDQPLRFPTIPNPADFKRQARVNPFGAKDLRNIRDICLFWQELQSREGLAPMLASLITPAGLNSLTQRLAKLFERNGSWRDDISPTYARLIQKFRQTEGKIEHTFRQLLHSHTGVLSETVTFTRNNRRVLAVKKDFKGKVRGILQDYSASGNTVFIEPDAIVQIQNQLQQLEFDISEELFRIRVELTQEILQHPFLWEELCPQLAGMDQMQALAIIAKQTQSQAICPNQKLILDLRGARHPFLDEAFAPFRQQARELDEPDGNRMVSFHLNLDKETRGLIISGANAGGKTVTLKTTALLAWMANSGLPIPVDEGSEMPFYDFICADIGDHQSLSHNLSTYASHLETMKELLQLPAGQKFIALDELGSGTDPQEGNALAQAIIEALVADDNHLLVTTHQQILCTLALNHEHLDNGSMIFDRRLLRPTYKFQQGVPGRSHALDIAANTGLPKAVLERAQGLIDTASIDVQAAIHQLQETNRELEKQKAKYRKEERRLTRRIADTKKEAQALEQEREKMREKSRLRIKKAVDVAERELRQILREASSRKQAKRSLAEFQAARKKLVPESPQKLEAVTVPASAKPIAEWQAGEKVFLPGWGLEGTLVSFDHKKALVNCNGKQLHTDAKSILHLENQTPAAPRVADHLEVAGEEPLSFELNLLGFRVEEALEEIDRQLDLAIRRQLPFLKIIHGHGTGALKTGIRTFLKSHPANDTFNLHIDAENDGVTELQFSS